MIMFIKKLFLAITIVFGGVIVFGLVYLYGPAAGITPVVGGGALYIWWAAYKKKNPSAKVWPHMPTLDKIGQYLDKKG